MIALAGITIGALAALVLAALVLGALCRDLLRSRRRRLDAIAQADSDAEADLFRRDFTEWCAQEADDIWAERRAA